VILPDELVGRPFAHRGLWNLDEAPENSLRAMEEACQSFYNIEFDVRLSADGHPVVFHDDSLERMTGRPERVDDLSAAELHTVPLRGTNQGVPTLSEVLHQVGGRVMVLIELKAHQNIYELEPLVAEQLSHYEGPFAVISFDAGMLGWFADNYPDFPRGMDASGFSDEALQTADSDLENIFEGLVDLARPHFLVLNKDMVGGRIATKFRNAGLPVIAWTIRGAEEISTVSEHCDNIIFEGFTA
jgi:glycerophosphoryl diester phosphodiesterase